MSAFCRHRPNRVDVLSSFSAHSSGTEGPAETPALIFLLLIDDGTGEGIGRGLTCGLQKLLAFIVVERTGEPTCSFAPVNLPVQSAPAV